MDLFRPQVQATTEAPTKDRKGFFEKAVFRGEGELSETAKAALRSQLPTLRKIGQVQTALGEGPITLHDLDERFLLQSPTSRKSLEQLAQSAAQHLREKFEIGAEAPIDIASFVWTRLKVPLCHLNLGDKFWGFYSSDKFDNPLIVFSNSHQYIQRNVFTIAHELGHHLFNGNEFVLDSGESKKSSHEITADAFAQEILVPSNALRRQFDEMGLSLVDEIRPHHIINPEELRLRYVSKLFLVISLSHVSSPRSASRKSGWHQSPLHRAGFCF